MSAAMLPPQLSSDHADFIEIVLRYLDNDLSEAEVDQLNEELRADPVKRQIFIVICRDAQLIHESQAHLGDDKIAEIRFRGMIDELAGLGQRRVRFWSKPAIGIAVAASLALVAALWMVILGGGLQPKENVGYASEVEPAVAVLTDVLDVVWSDKNPNFQKGAQLTAGRLHLEKGLAKIRTEAGIVITLEGPAEFELVSSKFAHLHAGRLTARVSQRGRGFIVETEALNLADLGTSFGVNVANGATEVAVFDGEVEVDKPSRSGATSARQILKRGKSVSANVKSTAITETAFVAAVKQFQRAWEMTSGVIAMQGNIHYHAPGLSQDPYRYGDLTKIIVFPERNDVELGAPLKVDLTKPDRYTRFFEKSVDIPAGEIVDSYLIQFYRRMNSEAPEAASEGTIQFAGEVIGIMVKAGNLQDSDTVFSLPIENEKDQYQTERTQGTTSELRGLETRDVVELSGDRRTISVKFTHSGDRDQIRVLVRR